MTSRTCIVLAGGLGTRLRSAVPDLPKCLAPVGNKPFLELQMLALASQGVDRFVLSLGYMADAVQAAVSRFTVPVSVDCVIEEQPLGTGGATLLVMHEAGLDEALVVNGDTFIEADLAPMMVPLATANGEAARMAAVQVDDRARYGGLELAGDTVQAFVEKGRHGPGLINAGLYRLHKSVFEGAAPGESFSIETSIMPKLMQRQALKATVLEGSFIDIGVPEDYYRFCERSDKTR